MVEIIYLGLFVLNNAIWNIAVLYGFVFIYY